MAREGLTPTPSKDLDVFGKELPLTSAEKQILTGEHTIFLKKALSIEIAVKKGEITEPRVLVISSSKCFLLSHKPTAKLETSFNFLRIQKLECTEKTLTFHLSREPRPLRLQVDKKDSVEILGLITAQLRNVFPVTPLDMIMQTVYSPVSLREDTTRLRDSLLSAMDRLDPASLHGFITAYGFLCDFFTVPFNEEVVWYLKNVYLTHGFRDLKLHDFNHLSAREVRPILSAVRHNEFFEGIIERDTRTDVDLLEEIGYVLNASRSLKNLVLHNCSLKPDNVVRLGMALKNNPKTSLTHLDLSHNPLDDKAMESLGQALESLTHGLQDLRLANCKMTPRAATVLANCMMNNKLMQHSLVHLDLSSNPLGPDPQGSLGFLKDPQTIATLNLSNCGLSFEYVTPVLMRGCQQHLRIMDLSMNAGRSKRGGVHGPKVASQFQQYFSSAISIASISLSGCKLSREMTVGILEGLCVNPNVRNIELNLSGNDLGSGRDANGVAKVIARTACLERLDVSESGIDGCLVAYVAAVRMNKNITHLNIGKNFGGKGSSRSSALKGISEFLSSSDCHLRSLCLSGSHLKDGTATILEALATNKSLSKLDISGNGMGNHGARRLAKALLSNCALSEVIWDHNDTSLHGFRDVATAMEHNYTLRVMPLPLHDISKVVTREPAVVETEVQKMQLYLCRNHSDERLKIQLAARHRQRLLTATQQSGVVGRELVQLEDLLKWSERGLTDLEGDEGAEVVAEAILIREEANKVVQLTDGLYSPHVETEQFDNVSGQVAELLDELMGRLHHQHVQENSERMVSQSVKACPSLLSDKDRNLLGKLVVTEMGSEFDVARKTVVHKVVPEIINPISATNLNLAATISEHLVEKTLIKLEKINSKLIKLQKALQKKTSSGATPDQKVSRAFTFRVEGEDQPKVKRRRALSSDSDIVDLPSSPLVTEAPQLEHIARSRPKPARLQKGGRRPQHKPAHLSKAKDEVDIGDFVKAVQDAEQNSLRFATKKESKAQAQANKTPLPLPAAATASSNKETKSEHPPKSEEEEKEEKMGTDEVDKAEAEGVAEGVAKEEEEEVVKENSVLLGAKDEEQVEEKTEPEKSEEKDEEKEEEKEEEEEEEKVVAEKSPPAAKKMTSKPTSSPRSPPLTPPPSPPHSPPHSPQSPPLITTETTLTDGNTVADGSSSSLEAPPTLPVKESSPSPTEDLVTRKKSRREVKKEEKEREKREKEEREREKKERERKEKEEKEREKKERERREREEKERGKKERGKKEKEERERERKERERREREEKEREKEGLKKVEKRHSSEDLLTVNDSGRDQRETSPGRGFEKRKSKTVRDVRKKSGLSKLFGRPNKGKEEGDETGDHETTVTPNDPHKSPRRQTTTPIKKTEEEKGEEERRGTVTPEPFKRPPPPKVKEKPVKSKSVDFGTDKRGDEEGEGEEKRRRPIGGVAAMPLRGLEPSQLTGVLKAKPSPQPRSKPSSEENSPALTDRTPSDSAHHSSPLMSNKTPPIAPRPRPKPKPRRSVVDVKEAEETGDDVSKTAPKPASRSATPTVSPDHTSEGSEKGEATAEEAKGGGEGKEGTEEEGTKDSPNLDKDEPSLSGNNSGAAPSGDGSEAKRSQTLV